MYACILIFFTTNMIEGQLISTGAFEVSLNGLSNPVLGVLYNNLLFDEPVGSISRIQMPFS